MVHLWLGLGQVGGYFVTILIHPILAISGALFYYDLRVRKEAFDLQLLMNQAGGPAGQTAGVGTTFT
jgi:hypothetical protein